LRFQLILDLPFGIFSLEKEIIVVSLYDRDDPLNYPPTTKISIDASDHLIQLCERDISSWFYENKDDESLIRNNNNLAKTVRLLKTNERDKNFVRAIKRMHFQFGDHEEPPSDAGI